MTGSAPTFLSAISRIASKTVASGAIDQTAGFFRAKSTPTVPAPAIPVENMAKANRVQAGRLTQGWRTYVEFCTQERSFRSSISRK